MTELCRFEANEEESWDGYVHRCAHATHFHLSGWRRVIEQTYGHRPFYLWAKENGEPKGILPIVLIRSILFGRSLVSLPFLDYGGICADDSQTKIELYQAALQLLTDYKVDSLDLRHRQPIDLELPLQDTKVTFTLELADNPDRMWVRLDGKTRNQIRKAQKSGLTVSWNSSGSLSDFYDVFATNMRDLGSPVHSRRFFSAILREFPESARVILVHQGSKTVGGGLCLSFKDVLLMPWASSQREYFSLCPNNLLYWEVIQWGCQKGHRRFDFGRSTPGTGPYHFKKQWGAVEESLPWQCVARNGRQGTNLRAEDPRYRWVIQTWQHLPLALTRLIGPSLRKRMSN